MRVVYTLTNSNELRLDYYASTDKKTVLNLTNHSYFDLPGQGNANVLDHVVTIHARRFTPVDRNLIPTGERQNVEGTPSISPRRVGDRIDDKNEQLKLALGYDHNYVLDRTAPHNLVRAARALHPETGRVLDVLARISHEISGAEPLNLA